MGNNYFEFKQFTVQHGRCAMKVGTDGVLTGAWMDVSGRGTILDVGTGSGLIALMAAQRNPGATVTAIEPEREAFGQAVANVDSSPFGDRITVLPVALEEFAPSGDTRFDLIVSNPPFFSRSLPSPDAKRTAARHTATLSPDDLFAWSSKRLSADGVLVFIYPYSESERVGAIAASRGFFLSHQTIIFPTAWARPKRVLWEFTQQPVQTVVADELIVEESRHRYTPEFARLVKDFYLRL